jgi:hypothetical protein
MFAQGNAQRARIGLDAARPFGLDGSEAGCGRDRRDRDLVPADRGGGEGLAEDIQDQLGGDYLIDIKFTLNKVVPPPRISEAINKAQAAFAGVTQAQGRLRAAEIDAKANQARQKGYEGCPACAAIDQLKAIPENVKTFAPGQNFAITP